MLQFLDPVFHFKKIISDLGLVCVESSGNGTYSIYLSDAIINNKANTLTFGTEIQAVNNSQKQEDQLEKQSTTEITSSQTNDSSKCTQGPYKTTFNTENGSFHSQSITGMSSNQGVSLNKGIFLINQQNNTASVDLQVEIKNFDQKNEQRENRLEAKIKNNLKQYWTVFTNTILVKINRRLNKLWFYVQQALEQKNYLSVPAIKRKYRINDYDFYIQSILTQW